MVRLGMALAGALGLAACIAPPRPQSTVCSAAAAGLVATEAAGPADPVAAVAAAVRAVSARTALAGAPGGARAGGQNFLVLSTGGQFGAFGAGFLDGWTGNGRPDFDLVTGTSAGATLAVPAALGPDFDPLLRQWRGLSNADLVRNRGLGALIGPSLYAVDGLERLVRQGLSEDTVEALRRYGEAGRKVLVGATDIDAGSFRVFDMTRAAQAGQSRCLGEAILASSAIPALFPPRAIDGALHSDGGLRAHVFVDGLQAAARQLRAEGEGFDATLTIIVNGDLRLLPETVPYQTLGVAARSAEIVSDQGTRESIRSLLDLSGDRGWRVRAITARGVDLSACAPIERPFDACVTRTLYDQGRALAQADPIPWLSADELAALVGAP